MKNRKQLMLLFATMVLPILGMVLWILGLDDVAGFVFLIIFILGVEMVYMRKYFEPEINGYVNVEVDPGGFRTANLIIDGDPETALETKDVLTFKILRTGDEA